MATVREISSLPLAKGTIDELYKHGFRVVSDFRGLKPLDLCKEVRSFSPELALQVLQTISKSDGDNTENMVNGASSGGSSAGVDLGVTAKDLIIRMSAQRPIITFCKAIDEMLGGGIQAGGITEVCGVPGVGKTQLAMQLALNVQIPEIYGGVAGEALYIDTEGSFMPERLAEMASELSTHLQRLARVPMQQSAQNNQEAMLARLAAAENMSMERFLEGVGYIRCHTLTDLLATLNALPATVAQKPRARLIILDSLAYPLRGEDGGTSTSSGGTSGGGAYRSRLLGDIQGKLNSLAQRSNCAVVVVNHVTTKISKTGAKGDEVSRLVPSLGEHWAHGVATRLLLYYSTNTSNTADSASNTTSSMGVVREARLLKSPSLPPRTVHFAVTHKGLRDAVPPAAAAGPAPTGGVLGKRRM
eukprot:gene24737-29892_t